MYVKIVFLDEALLYNNYSTYTINSHFVKMYSNQG